jgi:Flp pilus assembly protein TadG
VRALRREEGQILPLIAVGLLVVLLGFMALVLDVGKAYVVKRQLQSVADAAALAAADVLPDTTAAHATAAAYGPAGKNPVAGVTVTQTATAWCLRSITYCYGNAPNRAPLNGQANGVVVKETARVPTTFARLFGIDSISVGARSTACGMCAAQPLDIALVLDRTGSMSDNMGDLTDGVKTFLRALDPRLDYVTLLVLPPTINGARCTNAEAYPLRSDDDYAITSTRMSHDYLVNGQLNPSSELVKAVDCLRAGGSTAYKQALIAAQSELVEHGSGRENAQRVIVFESDGAANVAPASYYRGPFDAFPAPGHEDDLNRPCGSAVDYVNDVVKPSGTLVFTVAYAVGAADVCQIAPHLTTVGGQIRGISGPEGTITAPAALQRIASPGNAVGQANAGDMSASFQKIAAKLMGARLASDDEADVEGLVN